MKLLLVTVTAIAIFTVDGRDFSNEPEGHYRDNNVELFHEEIEGQVKNFLDGTDGNNFAEKNNSDYDDHQMKKGNLLVAGESLDEYFPDIDQQLKKTDLFQEEKEQHHKKLRRSKCKARNACVVMGGFCVTNSTLCSGRLVPEGCKGTNCQCCIAGTLEAKIVNLEEELQLFKENMNISNKRLNSELQSLTDNKNNINTNLNSKLNNMNLSLASLARNQGCPKGLFKLSASDQCFKFFPDSGRSWHAAKSKCQSEGLVLAKPYNSIKLRSYLVMRYGNKQAWVGGRGTGSVVKWDRDGTTLGTSNPLWLSGQPGSRKSSTYCIELLSYESLMKSSPTQTYYMQSCSHTGFYALCEMLME